MFDVVLKRAIEEYLSNFKVMISFGVLFIFLPLFVLFQQEFFLNSGTAYLALGANLLSGAIGIVCMLIFLYVFSFFISLTVYSVHRDLQQINIDTYWNTLFKNSALKIFFLYLVLAIVFYAVSYVGSFLNNPVIALVIDLIIGLVVMFAPQSIVLNESSIGESIKESVEFWFESPVTGVLIFVVASIILFVILGLELFIDGLGWHGIIVSYILVLIFLVPFIEQAKSYAFLLRVDLLKGNEVSHARAPKIERPKPMYGVRMREQPKHGNKL